MSSNQHLHKLSERNLQFGVSKLVPQGVKHGLSDHFINELMVDSQRLPLNEKKMDIRWGYHQANRMENTTPYKLDQTEQRKLEKEGFLYDNAERQLYSNHRNSIRNYSVN